MTQYRSWRHLLDFPKQGLRQNRKELDLADADKLAAEDDLYPSLADITLEGVPAVRNLISDLAMDVLLYQSGYRGHIAGIVQRECNRVYKLFKQRNPSFKGSISLCGHSLGSAVLFDILCHQPDKPGSKEHSSKRIRTAGLSQELGDLQLDFECDNFFSVGSPLALFQMLRGRTIAGRPTLSADTTHDPLSVESEKEARLRASVAMDSTGDIGNGDSLSSFNATVVSSPKCAQLFNIFHPSDPISYRIEPLISSAMASMKPQPLPYVKRSIWGASGQSLTNISARVGQSMGSLWFNFTSGVASSLLNRSLGLNDGMPTGGAQQKDGPDVTAGEKKTVDDIKNASSQGNNEQHLPTLLDQELETLYEGFQKRRASEQQDSPEDPDPLKTPEWLKAEDRARKLKTEEAKVRALNSNGRVDYSVQE